MDYKVTYQWRNHVVERSLDQSEWLKDGRQLMQIALERATSQAVKQAAHAPRDWLTDRQTVHASSISSRFRHTRAGPVLYHIAALFNDLHVRSTSPPPILTKKMKLQFNKTKKEGSVPVQGWTGFGYGKIFKMDNHDAVISVFFLYLLIHGSLTN